MSTAADDQFGTTRASDRARIEVFLDSLRNIVVSRLTVYFLVVEGILFAVGYGLHLLEEPSADAATAQYIMAGLFGVFGIIIAAVFALYLIIGCLFAAIRAYRKDF